MKNLKNLLPAVIATLVALVIAGCGVGTVGGGTDDSDLNCQLAAADEIPNDIAGDQVDVCEDPAASTTGERSTTAVKCSGAFTMFTRTTYSRQCGACKLPNGKAGIWKKRFKGVCFRRRRSNDRCGFFCPRYLRSPIASYRECVRCWGS